MSRTGRTHRRGDATMKIVGTLVVVVVVGGLVGLKLVGPSSASGGWHKTIDDGIEAAGETRKPLLVLYTADWCPPCKKLKAQVLHDSEVADYLEESFVLVKIDLTNTRGPNNEVAAVNGVDGIPTIQVFDADGNFIDLFQGPPNKAIFMRWAEASRQQG